MSRVSAAFVCAYAIPIIRARPASCAATTAGATSVPSTPYRAKGRAAP
jgi:hypothetical protein